MRSFIIILLVSALPVMTFGQGTPVHGDHQESPSEGIQSPGSVEIQIDKYEEYCKKVICSNSHEYNTHFIERFEQNRDVNAIAAFFRKSKTLDEYMSYYSIQKLTECIHFIDINNDGNKDVFYQGPTGSESLETIIFINENNNYKEIFRQFQFISEIEFVDNTLTKITLTNPGCCADPQVVNYFYTVAFENGIPRFNHTGTTGHFAGYEKLQSPFDSVQSFTIIGKEPKLRNACYEFDTYHPFYGDHGNVLCVYGQGAKGCAFGQKIDKGITWLFVLMDTKAIIDNNNNLTFGNQPAKLYGWIKKSETDLK